MVTLLPPGDLLERILRHIGLVRLDALPYTTYASYLAPEIIVLITCTVVYHICSKLHSSSVIAGDLLPLSEPLRETTNSQDIAASQRRTAVFTILGCKFYYQLYNSVRFMLYFSYLSSVSNPQGKYICLLLMCLAGILRPSILSAVYYLSFLGLATAWACNRQLGRQFAWFCRFLMVVLVAHITALFVYQLQWVQEQLPPKSQIPRCVHPKIIRH